MPQIMTCLLKKIKGKLVKDEKGDFSMVKIKISQPSLWDIHNTNNNEKEKKLLFVYFFIFIIKEKVNI